VSSVKSGINGAKSVNDTASSVIEQNAIDRALVEFLGTQALPLHGLLRAERALTAHLPPQLWVRKIEIAAAGGTARRKTPEVVIDVGGKELNGVEVGRVFTEFIAKFKADQMLAGATAVMKPVGSSDNNSQQFQITVGFGGEVE
jgi:hypothetical protein